MLQLQPGQSNQQSFSPQSSTHSIMSAHPGGPSFQSPPVTTSTTHNHSSSPSQLMRPNSREQFPYNPSAVTPKMVESSNTIKSDQKSPQYLLPPSNQYASPQESNYISPGASSITSNVLLQHPIVHSRQPLKQVPIPPLQTRDQQQQQQQLGNLDDATELVTVPLGANTTLKVNPKDTINLFTNASHSLNLEGPLWQQQGTFSYVGLTKSDPFIKIIRNYAILLFKSGEMNQYIKASPIKRIISNSESSIDSVKSSPAAKRQKVDGSTCSEYDLATESANEGEFIKDDTLLVTKINKDDNEFDDNNDNKNDLEDGTQNGNTQVKNKTQKSTTIEIPNILPGLSLLYSGKLIRQDYYKIVEQVILAILPDKLNAFMLLCRYFKYVHPFVPIIDEKTMLLDLDDMFGSFPSFSREKYSEIAISSDHSLNILGIFLLIIRLGYMSLIHNDDIQYDEDEKSMMKHMKQVSSGTFSRALSLCIDDAATQSKSSFKLVQALTLLHFYRLVDPKDCHGLGGADAHILFGVIITHAMSIGLNRDPTYYVAHERISKNEGLIKIWRALWHYLVFLDASTAIYNGSSLKIGTLDMSDVKMPIYPDKTGKLNELFRRIGSICQSYRQIVTKINNVVTKPKVVEILEETTKLEKLFYSLFGKDYFKEYICKPASVDKATHQSGTFEHETSFLKVLKFGIFIQLRTNLSCMYYMIAIHYENERNVFKGQSMNAGLELFKIYIKSVVQLVYIMSYVLDNSIELFGRNYDYILTSANERSMIKTHSFLTSFFVRLLHHKRNLALQLFTDPSVKPRLQVTDRLFALIVGESELFVGNFRRLSRHYINSYKLYVMTYFVLKQSMENPDAFFSKTINDPNIFHHGTNTLEFFTINELEYLCKLCEEFKSAKAEQLRLRLKQFPAKLDSKKLIQHFKKFDYLQPPQKDGTPNTTTMQRDMTNPTDDPPEVDISQSDREKFNNPGEASGPFKNVNNGEHNSNSDEYGLSDFSYGMMENPNIDLVQLFELFGEMQGKE
jgi:hypothetical protein